MIKYILVITFIFYTSVTAAQIAMPDDPDLDPSHYMPDNIYFHVGAYYGLSQPVATDLKKISLSGPTEHETAEIYEEVFKTVIERRGLKQYLETDFLVTPLFPESYTRNKSVFLVYKYDTVLEDYLALKQQRQRLIDAGNYDAAAKRDVARKFGTFFSYSAEQIEENIAKNESQ